MSGLGIERGWIEAERLLAEGAIKRMVLHFARILWFALVACPALLAQTTRYVDPCNENPGGGFTSWPTAAHSIQSAIDVAGDGDIIFVAPSTYEEHLVVEGKAVRLVSVCNPPQPCADVTPDPGGVVGGEEGVGGGGGGGTPDESPCGFCIGATVDGTLSGRCLRITNSGATTTTIRGFKFVNGLVPFDTEEIGGAISIEGNSRVDILDNVILISAARNGGGIGIRGNTLPVGIRCNLIRDNTAVERGGGVYVEFPLARITVKDNVFLRNATEILSGGGLMARVNAKADLDVLDNRFEFNESNTSKSSPVSPQTPGRGGAVGIELASSESDATLSKNVLEKNTAHSSATFGGGDGGAIALQGSPNLLQNGRFFLSDNTIRLNTAEDDGGGVWASRASLTKLRRGLIQGNDAADDGGGIQITCDADMIMRYATVDKNVAGDFGGGVSVRNARAIVRFMTLTKNTAQRGGGLAYLIAQVSKARCLPPSIHGTALLEIEKSTFEENIATGGAGIGASGAHVYFQRILLSVGVDWKVFRSKFDGGQGETAIHIREGARSPFGGTNLITT